MSENIILKSICKSFGKKRVLDNFSLTVPVGSRVCIMGASGGGKTTLLNIIMGIIKPDSGEICGIPSKIAAVFQEDRLCEPYSAVRNVMAVTGNSVPESEILELLRSLGLGGSELLPVKSLSGGMRRRVALARALLAESEMIVLDEPFKGLDEDTRASVVSILDAKTKGKTLFIATHDLRDASALSAPVVQI